LTPRKPRTPGRAVGYVRVSTADQADHGFSLEAQRQRIAAYCAARGWELVEVYADEGVSALKDRPEFERMVADVLADGVSHIVTLKLDRLGRSAAQLLNLYERMEKKGVSLVTIEDGIDTSTPVGRLLRTVLAAIAEFERDVISQRTKIGMAEAKAQGRVMSKGQVGADVRARIVAMRSEGMPLAGIAAMLNADGVPTGQGGKQWYGSSVAAVLASTAGQR
jgi:DNA invertase Pin-like site-specific DNA recombinase